MRCALLLLALAGTARAEAATSETITVGGASLELTFEPNDAAPRAAIEDWVRRAAGAISTYYGHFPVARVRIQIDRTPGGGIHGTTYAGRYIHMRLGLGATAKNLANDWTLTHEMFHLAFPDLDEDHKWMEEGMATYFEPLARARVGDLDVERVWRDLFEGLPKGLPAPGDRGLDRTPTWGRTYWGGCLFWFVADLAIRERTGNKKSVDDAMRAVLAAGGDGTVHWDIARVIEVGDRATGTKVLAETYARMATAPAPVDVDALAKRLGVGATIDDHAPLAAIRLSMTARQSTP